MPCPPLISPRSINSLRKNGVSVFLRIWRINRIPLSVPSSSSTPLISPPLGEYREDRGGEGCPGVSCPLCLPGERCDGQVMEGRGCRGERLMRGRSYRCWGVSCPLRPRKFLSPFFLPPLLSPSFLILLPFSFTFFLSSRAFSFSPPFFICVP